MAFNPAITNFLTVGNFTDASYGMPLSQPLVAAASSGLIFANAGGGGTYTLGVNGNLAAAMALQTGSSYGIMISVPQEDGGIITRQLSTNSTISLTHAAGQEGNPTLGVVPSSSLQLTAMQVGGSSTGASHSTLNLVAGTNIGITAVDTGTKTNVTINATIASGILAAPVVTYTASSDFTADQNIGLLTTGLLKNTVSGASGTLSTAVAGTDYLLPNADLAAFAALTPTNGDLLYYTGGAWSVLSPGVTGQFLKTTGSTAVAWAAGGDVTLSGTNAFTGTNTFNTNLPTSTVTPTTSTQLVTKAYADSIVGGAPLGATYLTATANGTLTDEVNLGALSTGLVLSTVTTGTAAITTLPVATFVDVTTAQTVAGIKTFSSAPVMSGASITSATIPIDSVVGTAMDLTTAQTVAGIKTFSSAPVMSGASITASTIPAASVSGTAGTLSGTNAWTGANTFNTALPTSTVTPTTSAELITKAYGDATYATSAGTVTLAGTNAWTGTNSFDTNLPTSTATPSTGSQLITKTYADATYGAVQPTATVTTTDATLTTLVDINPPAFDAVMTVTGTVNGRGSAANSVSGTFTIGAYWDNAGGVLSIIGTPLVIVNKNSTATFDAVVSGSSVIRVTVTGIAATTMVWSVSYSVKNS